MQSDAPVPHGSPRSVQGIAHDVPPPVGELRPDLVVTTRFQFHQDNGVMIAPAQRLVSQNRLARSFRITVYYTGPPRSRPGRAGIPRYHQVVPQNTLRRFRRRAHHRQIRPVQLSPADRTVNRGEDLSRPGKDHRSAYGLIDTVNRLEPGIAQVRSQFLHNCFQGTVAGLYRLSRFLCHYGEP